MLKWLFFFVLVRCSKWAPLTDTQSSALFPNMPSSEVSIFHLALYKKIPVFPKHKLRTFEALWMWAFGFCLKNCSTLWMSFTIGRNFIVAFGLELKTIGSPNTSNWRQFSILEDDESALISSPSLNIELALALTSLLVLSSWNWHSINIVRTFPSDIKTCNLVRRALAPCYLLCSVIKVKYINLLY